MSRISRKAGLLAVWWALPALLSVLPARANVDAGGEVPSELKVPMHAALSRSAVVPGGTLQIAVVYEVPPDAHIQKNEYFYAKPADGEPFALGEPALPKGDVYEGDPVYRGRTVVFYTARVGAGLAPGRRVLKLEAGEQACIEKPIFACFPPADSVLELAVEVVPNGSPTPKANEALFASMTAVPPAPTGGGGVETAAGRPETGAEATTGPSGAPAGGEAPGLTRTPAGGAQTGPGTAGSGTGGPADTARKQDLAQRLQAALARRSFLALLLVFLGGIASSFTPCVYPMIPITISYIGGRSKGKLSGFGLSVFFVLGIALMYAVLGMVAASTGALFGGAMQSAPVLLIVSAVFFAMGASMLGAFDLALPSGFQTKLQTGPHGGVVGAFLMGVVTGLVASPCVGPVVVVLLTWVAQLGSIGYGFLLLFVFALGLGMLFLVIGTFAGALSALPQAGQWMDTVKHVFGVILIAMGIFYLRTLLGPALTWILSGALVLMVGTFIGAFHRIGEEPPKALLIRKGFGIILLLAGGFVLLAGLARYAELPLGPGSAPAGAASAVRESGLAWVGDDASGRAQAQSLGRPALIDFYADWCAACKELDEKTWSDPAVRREGERFIAIKMDLTADSDRSKQKQAAYGVPGLPTVIFYNAAGQEVKRFSGFRPPEDVVQLMREIR